MNTENLGTSFEYKSLNFKRTTIYHETFAQPDNLCNTRKEGGLF